MKYPATSNVDLSGPSSIALLGFSIAFGHFFRNSKYGSKIASNPSSNFKTTRHRSTRTTTLHLCFLAASEVDTEIIDFFSLELFTSRTPFFLHTAAKCPFSWQVWHTAELAERLSFSPTRQLYYYTAFSVFQTFTYRCRNYVLQKGWSRFGALPCILDDYFWATLHPCNRLHRGGRACFMQCWTTQRYVGIFRAAQAHISNPADFKLDPL